VPEPIQISFNIDFAHEGKKLPGARAMRCEAARQSLPGAAISAGLGRQLFPLCLKCDGRKSRFSGKNIGSRRHSQT
jgi:hypothetical protein